MSRPCVVSFVLFAASVATLVAQVIPPGALSANKPVVFEGKQIATTGVSGDLKLALDSTKNYVVLHQECSRYEIVVADSEEAQRCERDDGTRNEQGCRRCEIAGYLFGGKWKPATPPTASLSDVDRAALRRRIADRFAFHLNGGVKRTTFTNASDACTTITGQLTELRYNQGVECNTDDSGSGGAVGGGVTINVTPNVGLYGGVQYERLGESSHTVDQAGRINVPGQSNLLLSVSNTNKVDLFNIDAGLSVGNDTIRVMPYAAYGRASIERTLVDRLLAGPPNTTIPPTLQVAGGTSTVENNRWGLGAGVRVYVYPRRGRFGLFGQYQQRTINNAFAPDDAGRNPVDFKMRGLFGGVDLRF